MKNTIILILLFIGLLPTILLSQIPRTLSYQGVLTDSLGNPKPDNIYNLIFRLYDVNSGGSALWTESKTLQVKRGLFTTILGDQTQIADPLKFDRPYWLAIQVESEPELASRIPLTAVGYSLYSIRSDTAKFALNAPPQGYVDSARITGTVPNNSITSAKIVDGTVQRVDVMPTFSAPYSDTATYAHNIPPITFVDSARVAGNVPDNSITSSKILDGTIQRTDVITTFTSPYADTAEYARNTPPIGYIDSARIAGTISDNSITSSKILDGTIQRTDVITTFTSPYADTAEYARNIPPIGFIDSARIAGNVPDNSITSEKISDGTIQRVDVTPTFTAPYSDTATYALNVPLLTYIDSARVAGNVPDNSITSAKILNGTILRTDVQSTFKSPYSDTADYAKAAPAGNTWSLSGNAGTSAGTNFVGTTDAQAFDIRTNNILRSRITTKGQIETYNTGQSVFLGEGAGTNDDLTSNQNSFIGYRAGYSNTTGTNNTATGYQALYSNTTGGQNTASGYGALFTNGIGAVNFWEASDNSAFGWEALYSNTTGYQNTAVGRNALVFNTSGFSNTATGYYSLNANLTGNSNTADGHSALSSNTTGYQNTASGNAALYNNTTGSANTAIGRNALYSNVAGFNATAVGTNAMYYANNSTTPFTSSNVAIGYSALRGSTTASANTGDYNTALGYQTLFSYTTGYANTASGYFSLGQNTSGNNNTANGMQTLSSNISGNENTAVGSLALYSNTTGNNNTANGYQALYSNTTGSQNTATGYAALYTNGVGAVNSWEASSNTAFGWEALYTNSTGYQNTAVGRNALLVNTSGASNTATGYASLNANNTGSFNTSYGYQALASNTTGSQNTAIGYGADVNTGSLTNASAIGRGALVSASNNMVFGNSSVVGWGFGVAPGAAAIRVGTDGTNGNGATLTLGGVWTNGSDSTKKYDIKNIPYGLSEVMKLRPVAYKLKGTDQQDIGFIAQEVKPVLPEIVYGEEGQMTLSYGQITSVLTKAVQELANQNTKLEEQVGGQQKRIEELEKIIKELQIQNKR